MGRTADPRVRKIQQGKRNKSYYITLPVNIIRELGWKEHQKVVVDFDRKKQTITIRDWKLKISKGILA